MAYNDRGQVTSESTTYGGVTYATAYSYDDRGRSTKVTHPSNRDVEYSYDSRSQLDTIKWNGAQIEDRGYDALGRLTSTDRPSVDESRTYFDNGQVKTIANGAVGTATYAYDANGNKQSESWSGAMSAWNFTTQSAGAAFPGGYDNEDRFMNFVQSGQSKTSLMTRSNIGNISNVSFNGSTTSRSYSSVHELETVGGASQSYDADGNLSTSLTGTSFDWDASGMMTTANVNGGPSVEYGYDASGKRIWKKVTDGGTVTETVFIHAGPNCIAEYARGAPAGSSGNEYIYAGGIDSLVMLSRSGASQNLAITRNQQWSVSALVSAGGSVVERYTYDLFGKRTILAANGSTVRPSSNYAMNYGYTSRRHETETGLMHFRARYYDPASGEFLGRDPKKYVDGMSQYRAYFVLGGTDPSGTEEEDCKCTVTSNTHFPKGDKTAKTGMSTTKKGVRSFRYYVKFRSTYMFRKPYCKCCEFRQYIIRTKQVIMFIRPDGSEKDLVPDLCDDELIEGCLIGGEFEEDCTKAHGCYGHRSGKQYPGTDMYDLPNDRPTGCFYEMEDTPNFNLTALAKLLADGKPPGDLHLYKIRIEAEKTFLQNIIDVCDRGSVRHSRMFDASWPKKEWTLKEILDKTPPE